MVSGVKIIDEIAGKGPAVERGDLVEFESQGFLSRGECIQEAISIESRIGARNLIAGIEYALLGMKAGGYRKVRISPHLAYRDAGLLGKIPPNAVLVYELRVKQVKKCDASQS